MLPRTADALLTTKEAMKVLSVARTTFYKLVALVKIRPVKLGRCSRWRPADLDKIVQWGLKRRAQPPGSASAKRRVEEPQPLQQQEDGQEDESRGEAEAEPAGHVQAS